MIFLIPAIFLSVCVGVIFKQGTTQSWPLVPLLVVNYATQPSWPESKAARCHTSRWVVLDWP